MRYVSLRMGLDLLLELVKNTDLEDGGGYQKQKIP